MNHNIMSAYAIGHSIDRIVCLFGVTRDEVLDTLIESCISGELGQLFDEVS